jgi:LacI family transcriptional regulator
MKFLLSKEKIRHNWDRKSSMARKRILLALGWYDYRLHRGVAKAASELGWHVISNHSHTSAPMIPRDWKGDGVIALISDRIQFEELRSLNCPIVDVGLMPYECEIPSKKVCHKTEDGVLGEVAECGRGELTVARAGSGVLDGLQMTPIARMVVDNAAVGKLAADHFLARGYDQVWVSGDGREIPMFSERYVGLKDTMSQAGGVVRLVRDKSEFFKSLDRSPQAFFGWADQVASQILHEAIDRGYAVPGQLAVLGCDNDPLVCENAEIPLSSVRSDQEGLGREAIGLLARQLAGESLGGEVFRHQPLGVLVRASSEGFSSGHPRVALALEYINRHLSEGLNAAQLAKMLKLSPQGLQNIFRENFHLSPAHTIRQMRLQKAKHHLMLGDRLADVAQKCGYLSLDSFCRSFKQLSGQSPGRWKRGQV